MSDPELEVIETVHNSFKWTATELEALGNPDDRLARKDVVAWLRMPGVAAGYMLDELVKELEARRLEGE